MSAIGRSTNVGTATLEQTLPVDDQPASFRYSNPGAQYPSAQAARFGQLGFGWISNRQYKIALFPNPVNGAAANFELLHRAYTGMTIGAAGTKWTGANGFGVPGYDPETMLTKAMIEDSGQAIALLKAIAKRESGRGTNLTEMQWRQAHDMFKAGSADAYLDGQPAPATAEVVAGQPSGAGLLARAREHIGEQYVNVQVPKDDAQYKGPWDCAEFVSWVIFQETGRLYGCVDDIASPAKADAYTGAFKSDMERLGRRVPVDEAASTVGGILLRFPPAPGKMGHIAFCDGRGGTVEAKGARYGVVADTVHDRNWDAGILIPGVDYGRGDSIRVIPPSSIYWINGVGMDRAVILRIQTALIAKGFNPGSLSGEFDDATQSAVAEFQNKQGLTVDGQVGPETAGALNIDLARPGASDRTSVGTSTPTFDPTNIAAQLAELLSKEKQMATDTSTPGQKTDLIAGLLSAVLQQQQLQQTNKMPDIAQLLTVLLPLIQSSGTGSSQSHAMTPDAIAKIIAALVPAIAVQPKGEVKAAEGTQQITTTVGQPAVTNPSVQIGAAGLGISSLLQAFGVLVPPFATVTGAAAGTPTEQLVSTLATVVPLVVAGFGATSGWSALAGIASTLFGAIGNAAKKT